jgi:ADP-ribose pyrophosphatase YjhB (NUDIX family)
MNSTHLAHGLARRGNQILLVASTYPNHAKPLWNLPGGRQERGELFEQTVVREILEETSMGARIFSLAYVAESYDGPDHFLSIVYEIDVVGTIFIPENDHVVDARWIDLDQIPTLIEPRVIREPLLAYLKNGTRYMGFKEAGISVVWRSNT